MASNGDSAHAVNGSSSHTVPLLINGKEVTTSTSFEVTSPLTNKVIWTASSASTSDANAAADSAAAALPSWSTTHPSYRRDILIKAASIISARSDELSSYMDRETGSIPSFSAGFNVPSSVEILTDVAGRIATSCAGDVPSPMQEGKSAMVLKEPYGVILSIAPWNAPYILGFRAVVYALAGGNTVVLKGSELCPRCWWAIGNVLAEAGLPEGVLNVVFHRTADAPAVTRALVEHRAVRKVNFTGSTGTGRIIAEMAGKALKPVLMELGGKAPGIVLKDADLAEAAKWVVLGAFLHSGQICMSTERAIVEESIVEKFGEELKKAIDNFYPQAGEANVLINKAGVEKNKRLVKDAVGKGARLLTGNAEHNEASDTRMRPIVVQGVKKDMDLFYTESFGPTISIYSVKDEDEALTLANDTEYGLSSAIFTKDLAKAFRMAKRIESGAVHINAMSVHDEAALLHGGIKMSGFGRFGASEGIEEFLKKKTITWMD